MSLMSIIEFSRKIVCDRDLQYQQVTQLLHNMNRKQNNAKCESASARPLVLELSAVANHAFGRELVSLKSNSEQRGLPS